MFSSRRTQNQRGSGSKWLGARLDCALLCNFANTTLRSTASQCDRSAIARSAGRDTRNPVPHLAQNNIEHRNDLPRITAPRQASPPPQPPTHTHATDRSVAAATTVCISSCHSFADRLKAKTYIEPHAIVPAVRSDRFAMAFSFAR